MTRAKKLLTAVLTVLIIAAVLLPAAAESGPPAVAASIHPLAGLLKRLAGEDFRVAALYGPGVHPRSAAAGEGESGMPPDLLLYIRVGDMLEGRADYQTVARAGRVVSLADGLELAGESPGEMAARRIFAAALGADAVEGQEKNPWFWLDPRRTIEAVDLMAAALADARPGRRGAVEERAALLRRDLAELDREIAEILGPGEERPLAVFSTSWSYFALHYGLREVRLSAVVPGGGPGRHSLKGAAGKLRETGTTRAFTDLTFPASPAEAVAARAGVGLVVLHPLGRKEAPDGDYFTLMEEAARAIAGTPP